MHDLLSAADSIFFPLRVNWDCVTNQGIGPRRTDTETLVTRETSAGRAPLVPFKCRAGRSAGNSRDHSLVQSPGVWERIQPSMGKLYHNGMIR